MLESQCGVVMKKIEAPSAKVVFKKIWPEAAIVWSVFFVTLGLFPGITSQIQSNSNLANDWFGIILVAIFVGGDFLGRVVPRWLIIFSTRTMWIPVILRYSFFVLFCLCIKPLVFHDNYIVYILMAVFAITNGYLSTLGMMFGPVKVDMYEKQEAGFIMSFALNFGIFCGVHFALLILYLLTGSIN